MGKVISVASFEEMDKASKNLQSISESYAKIASQLMQEASTMGSAFEGADNLAFVNQITGFTEELDNMAKKLSNASQALAKQCANYRARQDDNITQVKKLAN